MKLLLEKQQEGLLNYETNEGAWAAWQKVGTAWKNIQADNPQKTACKQDAIKETIFQGSSSPTLLTEMQVRAGKKNLEETL